MDRHFVSEHFKASTGLMSFGFLTMVYSLFTMIHTNDLRRLSALIALFHSGGLAILLYLKPDDKIIYYSLAGNVIIKTLLFTCMGILRIDLGSRTLSEVDFNNGIHKSSLLLFTIALGMSFILPFSPFFVFDLLIVRSAMESGNYFLILVPIMGVISFVISLHKILPLFMIQNRDFKSDDKKVLVTRINITYILLLFSVSIGILGLYQILEGSL
jgi:hydrogenase-4 component F